jgi:alcohol dehydrogenase (cytochrome c)
VYLVNARDTKNLPGRKSDVQESQWLMKLHTYGLLRNSFRPSQEIRMMRTALTQRSGAGGRAAHPADAEGDWNLLFKFLVKASRFLLLSVIVACVGPSISSHTWGDSRGRASFDLLTQSLAVTYTATQSDQGKSVYDQNCASCHGLNLDDGEFAPPLKGPEFYKRWGGKSAESLFTYMSLMMPPTSPGSLVSEMYAQIIAYLLRAGGTPPGLENLPSEPEALKVIMLPSSPSGPGEDISSGVTPPPGAPRRNPLSAIAFVSNALLNDPPADSWLNWRRTYDAQGFSPLKQITKANVSELRLAWAWSLPNGPNEATPLEHDGVMFVHGYGDTIQALDAATGDLLWQYTRRLPNDLVRIWGTMVKKSFSIYGDKLFVGTSDTHIVALDLKTGTVVWDRPVASYKEGYRISGGPLVAKGEVMIGTKGPRVPGGNYIVGLDAKTGDESWRVSTIPKPGEPGGNSWNGLPIEKRSGASVWVPGSYDPVLNLAFFGIAQTYDTAPLRHLVQDGTEATNDALYTDSTIAINPDTGKMVWYFQHQANDQWDLDWAFERQVIRIRIKGALSPIVLTGGKQTIFDILNAETGQYISSFDLGLQNTVISIDPTTGAKTVDSKLVPGDSETKMVCPHASGGRNWLPTSYNPNTKILFVPIVESCMDMMPVPLEERASHQALPGTLNDVRWTLRPRPDSDGKYGRLEAINIETKKVVWVVRERAPRTTGILSTSGGVVFAGSLDRVFAAYDDATGRELWRARLNDVPSSAPITYMVNGKQYVAMVVGNGGGQASSFSALVPEIQNPPAGGAAVWVFALPDKVKKSLRDAWRCNPYGNASNEDIC